MAEENAAPVKKPAKSKKPLLILIGTCAVGAILLKLSFIFFFIGMLPATGALLVDNDKNKYIFSTVAALNFAGVFPPMMDIYVQGSNFDAVTLKLSDGMVWLTMYGAAGIGWALVWLSPILAAIVLDGVYKGRIRHLVSVQRKLEEEWGPEVKGSRRI